MALSTKRRAQASMQVKAAGKADDLPDGAFEAYASVFGNRDSYGDIVDRGAFAHTLDEWRAKGDPIPLLWGHEMYNLFSHIGVVYADKSAEDEIGLRVYGQIDLSTREGEQVYRLIKGRRVTDLSFAYEVLGEVKGEDGNHLTKLALEEVSIVPIGANRLTDVLTVKAAVQEGARCAAAKADEGDLRGTLEALKDAVERVTTLLTAGDKSGEGLAGDGGQSTQDEQASGTADDNADEDAEDSSAEQRPSNVAASAEDRAPHPSAKASSVLDIYDALLRG